MIHSPSLSRRSFLGVGAAIAGGLALTACGGGATTAEPASATTLRLPGSDVGFPSPFAYTGGQGYVQTTYLYDTLLWKDASGQYSPWLATDTSRSDDGLTYTVTLREGVTWSDGQPLTAEDVAFTFRYFLEKAGQIAPSVIVVPARDTLEDARATGPLTVEFRLRSPDWTFERFSGLGGVPVVPAHIWSSIADPAAERRTEVLVGTGPYRLESFETGTGAYLFTAREDYFLGTPRVGRIEHRPVDDQLAALLAGDLDQAGGPGPGLRPQAVDPFRDRDGFRIIDAPTGSTALSLYWNVAADGPTADLRFRQACAHALNRQAMSDRLFGGTAALGSSGLIPDSSPYHASVQDYAYDVARAEQLLDEAGFTRPNPGQPRSAPDGRPLSLELLISNAQPSPGTDLVVADLAAVGVEVRPAAVDQPTFLQRIGQGQTQMSMLTIGGVGTDEQPDYLRKVYLSTTRALQKAPGYANPEVDRLLGEQRAALDEGERTRIAAELQHIVADDLPMLPLLYPPSTTIVRTEPFDSWYTTPGGIGGLVPSVNNKHAFITGQETGLPE